MIPKVIHYCWFGGNSLPDDAKKCIASWRKHMPEYEIKEWNESNFDVNIIPYTREAYQARKYAFVSDYARFWILYHYGGVYFDTDVEVIRSLDEVVENGPFLGYEVDPNGQNCGLVNPGQGMGCNQGNIVYEDLLDRYAQMHFMNEDGSLNMTTIVKYTTTVLVQYGLCAITGIQNVEGIYIYPKNYFNPFDDITGKLCITPDTYTIHWYSKTWLSVNPIRQWLSRIAHRIFGLQMSAMFRKMLGL